MVTETRNINNFEEVMVSSSGELKCNSVDKLLYYEEESKKIIEERQDKLFGLSLNHKLYYIERIVKDEDNDNTEERPSLCYDGFEMFFTSVDSAYNFMDSFMDIGMKAECSVVPIECYRDLVMTIYSAFLADDLVIKRIEYKDGAEVWNCADLLYDPKRNYEYKEKSKEE